MNRILLLISILLITLNASGQSVALDGINIIKGSPTDLRKFIEIALANNYSIKIAEGNKELLENNVTYAPFLPTLSANANTGQNKNYGDIDSKVNSSVFGASLSWRLFDGFSMFASYDIQRKLLEKGELALRMEIENLVSEVANSYYYILVQNSRLESIKVSLMISLERYNQAREKYIIGSSSALEMRQAKIDLNADSSKLVRSEESLHNSYTAFNTLLNTNMSKQDYIADSIILSSIMPFDELENLMLNYNTMIGIAAMGTKISEVDLKLARSARYPSLDFGAGYNFNYNETLAGVNSYRQQNGPSWGFTLSVPIFNRTETSRKIKNAKVSITNSEYGYKDTELKMRSELLQLYTIYTNNMLMINFESESAENALANLEIAAEQYKLGLISGTEFREIQRGFVDATDRKLSSIYQAKVSELSLLILAGQVF